MKLPARITALAAAAAVTAALSGAMAVPAASAATVRPAVAAAAAKLTPTQRSKLEVAEEEVQIALQLADAFKAILLHFWNTIKESERVNDLVFINDTIAALQADLREIQAELKAGVITAPVPVPTKTPPAKILPGKQCSAPPGFVCITSP